MSKVLKKLIYHWCWYSNITTYERSTSWREKILNLKREIKDPELARLFHSFLHKKSLYVRIFTLSIAQREFYQKFSRKKKLFLVVLPLNRTRKFSWSRGEKREREQRDYDNSQWLTSGPISIRGWREDFRTFESNVPSKFPPRVIFFLNFPPFWEFKFKINIIPNALFFT